jgi:hypothetical protein
MDMGDLAEKTTMVIISHLKGKIREDHLYGVLRQRFSLANADEVFNDLEKSPDDADTQAMFRLVLKKYLAAKDHFAKWLESPVAAASERLESLDRPKSSVQNPRKTTGGVSISANADMLTYKLPDGYVDNLFRKLDPAYRYSLREWWFEIQRSFPGYSCYGIFLVLPSDEEAKLYLALYGVELDIISRDSCLIIFLADGDFKRPDIHSSDAWLRTISTHVVRGGSAQVARLFDIEYDSMPCLFLFEDIRSDKHIIINLKGLTAQEIAEKMRTVFSVIEKSILKKQNALVALERYRNNEKLQYAGKSVVTEIRGFVGKTMETAMEAWLNAMIK